MADEQQLNSVERFRKRSGRLVLEEHGHCEVPAGCGGVVLRWRNPQAAFPLTIHFYSPGKAQFWIDGAEPASGRVDLPPGRHTLAFCLDEIDLSAGLLMFAGHHDPQKAQGGLPGNLVEAPLTILSAADGSWKYILEQPPSGWNAPAFNDQAWHALAQTATPQLTWQDPGGSPCRRCDDLGAACLGLPAPAAAEERQTWWQRLLGASATGTIWIRKVFEIPAPQPRESSS